MSFTAETCGPYATLAILAEFPKWHLEEATSGNFHSPRMVTRFSSSVVAAVVAAVVVVVVGVPFLVVVAVVVGRSSSVVGRLSIVSSPVFWLALQKCESI